MDSTRSKLKKFSQDDLVRLRHELSGTFACIDTVSKYVGIAVSESKKQVMLEETIEASKKRIKNIMSVLQVSYIPTKECNEE